MNLPHQSRKYPVPLDRNENYQSSGMLVADPQCRNDLDDSSWQQKSPFDRNVMWQKIVRNEILTIFRYFWLAQLDLKVYMRQIVEILLFLFLPQKHYRKTFMKEKLAVHVTVLFCIIIALFNNLRYLFSHCKICISTHKITINNFGWFVTIISISLIFNKILFELILFETIYLLIAVALYYYYLIL